MKKFFIWYALLIFSTPSYTQENPIAKKYGTIKGIIWHQGEADANAKRIPLYEKNLETLFTSFRSIAGNDQLPIIMGELGAFSKEPQAFESINKIIRSYPQNDPNSSFIKTSDLMHKGDSLHFNSAGQRMMGERYAKEIVKLLR